MDRRTCNIHRIENRGNATELENTTLIIQICKKEKGKRLSSKIDNRRAEKNVNRQIIRIIVERRELFTD